MPTIAAFGNATITGNDMGELNFFGGGGEVAIPPPTEFPSLAPIYGDLNRWFGAMMSAMLGGSESPEPQSKWWWQNPITAGLQINIPIFAGNTNVNRVRQARTSLTQLRLQKDYAEQGLRLQAQSSINNIFAATERMIANQKTVEQAQKAYRIAEVRFNSGAGTMLELNSAQLSLTQARLNYSQAVYDYLAAQADHEKTVGSNY
jgi:outer membrane protein TolC